MTAVIGMVAVILGGVGLATGTILSSIMRENLDGQVQSIQLRGYPSSTAADILNDGRQETGTLLVYRNPLGLVSGAYVSTDAKVATLSDSQISQLLGQIESGAPATVRIDDLGEYRVFVSSSSGSFAVYGLPTSEVTSTLGQIVTTVGLVTVGGLLILGVLLAIIIRRSLAPLRSVAATAERVAAQPLSEGEVTISERVPAAQTDDTTEIGRVGASLNTLLDHVESSLDARQRNEERMRRFVADASHELRTPLASIRGYSELSLRDPTLSENTESALERIQAQSLRMTALVEDLLLLARLEEGQELVYGAVDLSRLAIESIGDARVAGRDHEWILDVGEDPVVIAGDEPRLHQVVTNLLANARTHTPPGTTVTLSVAREEGEAVLRVHDDGPGVDPSVAQELFERFSRADRSRARNTGGTGLGLSIVRAIVHAHGGEISVRSQPGDTTFIVRLPAKPADPARAEAESDAAPTIAAEAAAG
ncbi:cell wall metabolism sensor histidine kinase WalK [Microbacterium sp. SORGH_AS_0888]|uniref:sensor histidine kinase n=1 Tax=Microbacterium sp. SORGH_AS_0888 TaxID=3041791 RepID=UPI002782C415|nr:HAMP domain-containing sensor histidine kinase [Microbacterium sp. SORGH_AS_0888]MDQ1128060.1 two-component system OmpR family sensor kinase [Microbacterium sp. SORGH_AS_0888]